MFERTVVFGSLFCAALIFARAIDVLVEASILPSLEPRETRAHHVASDVVPLSAFLERNLFRASLAMRKDPVRCEQSSLRSRLVATIIGDAQAIAWFHDGEQLLPIRAGERLEGVEVLAIERSHVRFAGASSCPEVTLAQQIPPAVVRRAEPSEIVVRRGELEAILSDPMRYGRDVRIVPRPEQRGFALHAVQPGGIAARFGFANGDVIQRINGHRLDEPGKLFGLLDLLRGPELAVDYLRSGEPRTLTVRIE